MSGPPDASAPARPPWLLAEVLAVCLLCLGLFVLLPQLGAEGWQMAVWVVGPCVVILLRKADPDGFGLGLGRRRAGLFLALAWTLGTALGLVLLVWLWRGTVPLHLDGVGGKLLDHIFGIALPEEVFFRGYLQTRLDQLWPPRRELFGARLGVGWLLASALFALTHLIHAPSPARLLTFFPGLVFGYLRARTRSVAAPTVYHGLCNVMSGIVDAPFA